MATETFTRTPYNHTERVPRFRESQNVIRSINKVICEKKGYYKMVKPDPLTKGNSHQWKKEHLTKKYI